jgi:hypothetical protein
VWDGQPLDPAATPQDRIRLILLDDHTLSNREAARLADATPEQVQNVRYALTSHGLIPVQRVVTARFPQHAPLPRSPRILGEGACVGIIPSPWTSDDPQDRAHAQIVCITQCHVASACLAWALRAVPVSDTAIYGGTTASERRALRAAYGLQRPNGVVALNAAKTCCPQCGLPLAGENLITERGREPGKIRRRCRACTRQRKAAAHAARQAAQEAS